MTVQQHERRGEERGRDDGKTWIDSMNKALLIIREKKEERRRENNFRNTNKYKSRDMTMIKRES